MNLLNSGIIGCILMIYSLFMNTISFSQNTQINKEYDAILSPESGNLTLDVIIGVNEKDNDKFLLVDPGALAVLSSGDILIFDEYSIKVYNKNGFGKIILGRKGYGPGEFESSLLKIFADNEYIWTGAGPLFGYVTVYNKEFKFLNKIRIMQAYYLPIINKYCSNINLPDFSLDKLCPVNEHELLISMRTKLNKTNMKQSILTVKHDFKNNIIEKEFFDEWNEKFPISQFSGLYIQIITRDDIIFINPESVYYYPNERADYEMCLYSFADNRISKYVYDVKPELITEEQIKSYRETEGKDFENMLRTMKYDYPIASISSDNNYIYISFKIGYENNKYRLMHIIDYKTKKIVKKVLVPVFFTLIKDNKLFLLSTKYNEFPTLYVYKINPFVFK